jgi:hypothetical protein
MRPECTSDLPCINYFTGMGFRPAEWAIQRDQYGDRPLLIMADDSPLEGKYGLIAGLSDPFADLPSNPYLPQILSAPGTSPLASAGGGGNAFAMMGIPFASPGGGHGGSTRPGGPGTRPGGDDEIGSDPVGGPGPDPDAPSRPVTTTPVDPGLQVTPVPLSDSGLFLLVGMVLLVMSRSFPRLLRLR